MPQFSYQVREHGPVSVVEVSGDVDMAVAGELTEVLQPLVTHKDVVLDCSAVTFFDSMGLRVAISARTQAERAGTTFVLVPSPVVSRVLELAGVAGIFATYDSPPDTAG